jgi:hypothetical protein
MRKEAKMIKELFMSLRRRPETMRMDHRRDARATFSEEYKSFAEFYPFYLSEHSHRVCRRLHVIGSALVLMTLVYVVFTRNWAALLALPVLGYGFAWVGHFFFEKNRPATFAYPLYSFMGDWVMFRDVLIGKMRF